MLKVIRKKMARLNRRLSQAIKTENYALWRRFPIRTTTVLYESFAGNGVLCNPEAIFRSLLSDVEFATFRHVWVLRSAGDNRSVVEEFAGNRRVRFVRPHSFAYFAALATSGYLINNATFPPEFGKRSGQIYLNTWHGTPLKRMGFDIGEPASRVGNVIRNFLAADFLLAANQFMADQMYEKAHLLTNVFRGKVIEEGYPRIDRQFLLPDQITTERQRLEDLGMTIGERKIILYAPTWKGTSFSAPEDDIEKLVQRLDQLDSLIDTTRYVVLLKTHQVVHQFAGTVAGLAGRLVANEIPTNTILGCTDILITDYSSVFFDFLATGRPILFLTPDIDDYSGYRGLYIEPDDWPGPVVRTTAELGEQLNALVRDGRSDRVMENYRAMQRRFSSREDGGATERVIDIVFRGRESGYRVAPIARDGRQTVLINAGSMRPNGITASLLNLLDRIDHERFDVSVVFPISYRTVIVDKQREINANVRQFARVGTMNGSKFMQVQRRFGRLRGDLTQHSRDAAHRRLWDDEWTRCFGATTFDFAIDFSGYGPFWSTLMLHSPRALRSIWLHNDLASDAHRAVPGKSRQLRDLTAIFSLYPEYDHLVSVSPALAEINSLALGAFAPIDRFTSANNLVNVERIEVDKIADLRLSTRDPATGEVPAWVDSLDADDGVVNFVTVGRLSSEKNQARLIRAFARVHRDDPLTRLVIVGEGAQRPALTNLIAELLLAGSVVLVGHQPNPAAIVARCDCFVLSSDYEGQPMVILEALAIGIPVVTTDFGSVRDALPEGAGLIVATSDDGLVGGMRAFLAGDVVHRPFDSNGYNREAIDEFYEAIGAEA